MGLDKGDWDMTNHESRALNAQKEREKNIGKKFGKLTIVSFETTKTPVMVNCVCECGTSCVKNYHSVIRGNTKSCGCNKHEVGEKRIRNLTGQKFGRLFVLQMVKGRSSTGKSKVMCECLCDCGNPCIVASSNLKTGHTKSCGCYNKEVVSNLCLIDLTGMQFNELTVVSRADNHNGRTMWNCKCSCGRDCVTGSVDLIHSGQLTCGCGTMSKGETKITKYLENNDIQFEYQKTFEDLKSDLKRPLPYDFYIPKFNALIEFQGLQHYKPSEYFGGQYRFERQLINDKVKKEYAINNGYKYIEIPYTQLNNIENLLSVNLS